MLRMWLLDLKLSDCVSCICAGEESAIAKISIAKKKNIIASKVRTVETHPITRPAMPIPLLTGFFKLINPVTIAGIPVSAPKPVNDTMPSIKAAIASPFSSGFL